MERDDKRHEHHGKGFQFSPDGIEDHAQGFQCRSTQQKTLFLQISPVLPAIYLYIRSKHFQQGF